MSDSLKGHLVRLAHENKKLRKHLLPILKKADRGIGMPYSSFGWGGPDIKAVEKKMNARPGSAVWDGPLTVKSFPDQVQFSRSFVAVEKRTGREISGQFSAIFHTDKALGSNEAFWFHGMGEIWVE